MPIIDIALQHDLDSFLQQGIPIEDRFSTLMSAIAYVETRTRLIHDPITGDITSIIFASTGHEARTRRKGRAGELGIFQITPIAHRDVMASRFWNGPIVRHAENAIPATCCRVFIAYTLVLRKRWGTSWLKHYNIRDKAYTSKVDAAIETLRLVPSVTETNNRKPNHGL